MKIDKLSLDDIQKEYSLSNKAEALQLKLLSSYPFFCQFFFKTIALCEMHVSSRADKYNHVKIIQSALIEVYRQNYTYLNINVPPGHGKSTLLILWVCWCLSKNPSCHFLYLSCSSTLAEEHAYKIRLLLNSNEYKAILPTRLMSDSSAKSAFKTTAMGGVVARGIDATFVGYNAGQPYSKKFCGGVIIDDSIKPVDAFSSIERDKVWRTYLNAVLPRQRSSTTPIINLCQRVHERDLSGRLLNGEDGNDWDTIILRGICEDGNPLDGEIRTLKWLENLREKDPYTFYSQYQQEPVGLGDTLFSRDDLIRVKVEHESLYYIFILVDCAETENKNNDATAFVCFGVMDNPDDPNDKLLVVLDAEQIWEKSTSMIQSYIKFHAKCRARFSKVNKAFIEQKSMGVALIDHLALKSGFDVEPVKRNNKMSKMDRIAQSSIYSKSKNIVFLDETDSEAATTLVIEHLCKITSKGAALLDIADCVADGARLLFVDKYSEMYYSRTKRKSGARRMY